MMYYFDDHDLVRLRPSRLHLETLLPQLRHPVLDIGRKPYTAHYEALVAGKYLSVDNNPKRQPGLLADILGEGFVSAAHAVFPSFGSVLFVGMVGFGIDRPDQIRRAFEGFHALLDDQGEVLIGWNEPFLPRRDLAKLIDFGFETDQNVIEPAKNPEQLYFWTWKKVDKPC